MTNTKKHQVRGEWLTIHEISKKYGVAASTLLSRVSRGKSGDSLAEPADPSMCRKVRPIKPKVLLIEGEEIEFADAAVKYKLNIQTLYRRKRMGDSDERAVRPFRGYDKLPETSPERPEFQKLLGIFTDRRTLGDSCCE